MAEYKQPVIVPNADIGLSQDPNKLRAQELNKDTGTQRVSAGDAASKIINKNGETKQRGSGAATKGFTSRGPMA